MPVCGPFYSMELLAAGAKGYQVERMRGERMKEYDKLTEYIGLFIYSAIFHQN